MQRVLKSELASQLKWGITSAHAESTAGAVKRVVQNWDHLCACREYDSVAQDLPVGIRITSAHAESTSFEYNEVARS